MEQDWRAALQQAAAYGFRELEIGKPPADATAAEFLKFCKAIELKPVAGGIPLTTEREELLKAIAQLQELGVRIAVNYWPWKTGGPFTLEDCKWSVETLNIMGEVCSKEGMTFCWHNHDKEFIPMETGLPFHYLMDHCDPSHVQCQLDVFWAAKGGRDPLLCLQEYPGRYPILHLKDMTADAERTFECVGRGIIDFPAILAEAKVQGIRHFMVEKDRAVDGLDCLKTSIVYLKSLAHP
jgi:sugar phosphate isomerase/epimerase